MAADDDIHPPRADASETTVAAGRARLWRRIPGGVLMGVGAIVLVGFLVVGVVVALTFVEWRAAFDGLVTIAMVCGPFILLGLALIALGRWLYGDWRSAHPLIFSAGVALPVAGVIAAFAAIGMFFWAQFAETGRGGAWVFSQFLVSIIASLGLVVVGYVLKRRASAP